MQIVCKNCSEISDRWTCCNIFLQDIGINSYVVLWNCSEISDRWTCTISCNIFLQEIGICSYVVLWDCLQNFCKTLQEKACSPVSSHYISLVTWVIFCNISYLIYNCFCNTCYILCNNLLQDVNQVPWLYMYQQYMVSTGTSYISSCQALVFKYIVQKGKKKKEAKQCKAAHI